MYPYPAMGVCAVGAWLVRRVWLGMLANQMLYKTTIPNVVPAPRDYFNFYITSAFAFDDPASCMLHVKDRRVFLLLQTSKTESLPSFWWSCMAR